MIVRISGEGQFRLPDSQSERLGQLDNRAVHAVEEGDETGFRELWSQMLELVETSGAQVDDELAKMKAELGQGSGGDAPALGQGQQESAQ